MLNVPTAVAGLLRRIWPRNFEERFKYRDERRVNARQPALPPNRKNADAIDICPQWQSSVYRRAWDNDNHCRKALAATFLQPRVQEGPAPSGIRARESAPGEREAVRTSDVGAQKSRGDPRRVEQGRRRTRQDQISARSPKALGETAEREAPRPNEERLVSSAAPIPEGKFRSGR
ncbi:MAG TPA: hypothetical protein VNJ49_14095 [Bradyrhizobium sp.]|nr:hypothetical protein [Bradyrhizobium sp.]